MHKRAILLTVCVAQFMVTLDITIIAIALPSMGAALDLDPAGQQWIVNAYVLVLGGCMLAAGRASDVYGRRPMFCGGLALFSVASLAGGFAESGGMLIAARAMQGLGAAIFTPSSFSLLTTTFPVGAERARSLAAWGIAATMGGVCGIVLGGVLTDLLSWRWVMFVNAPVGIALIVVALRVLPEGRRGSGQVDVPGAMLVTTGVAALTYAVVGIDRHSWNSAHTLGFLALALVVLALFALLERRSPEPMLPVALFRVRAIVGVNAIAALLGGVAIGQVIFLSLFLQQAKEYSPLHTALLCMPTAIVAMPAIAVAARLMHRFGARMVLIVGSLMAVAGLLWWSQLGPDDAYFPSILAPIVLGSVGTSSCFPPMFATSASGIPLAAHGMAAGLLFTSRQVGGALILAVLTTVAAARTGNLLADGTARPEALTSGYGRALIVMAFGAALVAIVAAVVLPRHVHELARDKALADSLT